MTQTETAPRPAPAGFRHEFRNGLWRQKNVVFALIFKEFKSKSENNDYGGMIWLVLDPLINLIVLAGFWYLARRQEIDGVNVALFIAVGTVPYTIVRMSMSSIPSAIKSNRSFYNFQQVKPIDSVIARFILNVTLATLGEFLMFFLIAWFLDLYPGFDYPMQMLGLWLLSLVLGFAVALCVATFGSLYDIIFKVIGFLSRPMMFISAVFHDADSLPTAAQYWISWNPITQINEILRYYVFGLKPFNYVSLNYTLILTLSLLFFGFIGYYRNRLKLIQTR